MAWNLKISAPNQMTEVPRTSLRKRKINGGTLGILRGMSQPIHEPSPSYRMNSSDHQSRLNTSAYVFEPQVEIFHKKRKSRKPRMPSIEFGYKPSPVAMPAISYGETAFSAMCIENQSEEIVSMNDALFPDIPLMPEEIVRALPSPRREYFEEPGLMMLPSESYEPSVKPQTTKSHFKNTPRALKDILQYRKSKEDSINFKQFEERRYATLIYDPKKRRSLYDRLPNIMKKYEPWVLANVAREVKEFA